MRAVLSAIGILGLCAAAAAAAMVVPIQPPALPLVLAAADETGEYGRSIEKGRIESLVEYHDSRGLVSYLDQELGRLDAHVSSDSDQGLIARFKAVLVKAQAIVAPLLPPDCPIKPVSEYRAVAAEARDLAKR